ncbi:MAG: LysR family transcriptional regulator [Ruminococcaceae bacterium]|nr:LysR family transcriptional regulator [Oscillospiraceae bacterium]
MPPSDGTEDTIAMTLTQLTYFKKLCETSHMGRAAEQLFISQPSLSVSIARLEEELGVKLFTRAGHHLTLTAEGSEFLWHADHVLREAEEAKEHMSRLADRLKTRVCLGCIAPVLYDYLPNAINGFLALPGCGNTSFEFSVEGNDELIRKLKNGVYDFVLCAANRDESLSQIRVFSEPLMLISPIGDPKTLKTWEELAAETLIGCEEGSFIDRMLREMAQEKGVEFHFAYRATTEDAIFSLVEHGFGYAVMPWSDVLKKKYAIQQQKLPDGVFTRDIYLTILRDAPPAGAAERFAEHLKSTRFNVGASAAAVDGRDRPASE